MVLYKRKPVMIPPPRDIREKNAQVWHIAQTGEIFSTYEEYLTRIDFYSKPRFICQITGQSGLTFFDALKNELASAEEVEQAFPEALKGPVLRKVQFETVSRIDALVDRIYDEFRSDFYPGEEVTVAVYGQDGREEKLKGVVRDKTRFGSKIQPDGSFSTPYSRYFVSLDGRPDEEAVVDDQHIFRDRKIFTKSVLRAFIKKTVTREAWNGAPWLVRHDYADLYNIDTRVPHHLRYDNKLLERKQIAAQKRALQPGDVNGILGGQEPVRLPELKPAPKSMKNKTLPIGQAPPMKGRTVPHLNHHLATQPTLHHFGVSMRPTLKPITPPPPPPPKYPIEDLQVGPRAGVTRPSLKFLCKDPPVEIDEAQRAGAPFADQILMKSVGPLLETWDTLNVYCETFRLDSFTFDDYVEALSVYSEATPVELVSEIHCAILKILVSAESDGGKVQITLPEIEEEDEDDEEEAEEEAEEATPEPEPERPPARATRRSLAKLEAERLAAEAAEAEKQNQAEPEIVHRAEDLLRDYDWVDQLRQRQFPNGGWERIVVGLLHQLSKKPRQTKICEDILRELVPPAIEEPTQETVAEQYARLDVNTRVQILQILCMLTTETKAIRAYMEDCSETMTLYRKDKIEWQRTRKQAIEDLKPLHEERKILLPDNMPPSPPPEEKPGTEEPKTDGEASIPDTREATEDSDEDVHSGRGRGLRKARISAAEKKRKEEEEAAERKREAELAAKAPKQSKQFLKILKEIEKKEELIKKCEEEINVIDNDLREADCPRTRVLGKDRFWNRYYWFERNGMPYEGMPNSSTAEACYANGLIWVQGPDDLEREGYIDLSTELQNEYKAKFNMTVPERKRREEGSTSVFNARQWGFFSEPKDLDALLEWLDPRGFNELKLRKELIQYKDKIVRGMESRKLYIEKPDDNDDEAEEKKRVSARTRRQTPEPKAYRCMAWKSSWVVEETGHLHCEPPSPPQRGRKGKKREAVESLPEPPRKTRRR